jgi:hypothetical protein
MFLLTKKNPIGKLWSITPASPVRRHIRCSPPVKVIRKSCIPGLRRPLHNTDIPAQAKSDGQKETISAAHRPQPIPLIGQGYDCNCAMGKLFGHLSLETTFGSDSSFLWYSPKTSATPPPKLTKYGRYAVAVIKIHTNH